MTDYPSGPVRPPRRKCNACSRLRSGNPEEVNDPQGFVCITCRKTKCRCVVCGIWHRSKTEARPCVKCRKLHVRCWGCAQWVARKRTRYLRVGAAQKVFCPSCSALRPQGEPNARRCRLGRFSRRMAALRIGTDTKLRCAVVAEGFDDAALSIETNVEGKRLCAKMLEMRIKEATAPWHRGERSWRQEAAARRKPAVCTRPTGERTGWRRGRQLARQSTGHRRSFLPSLRSDTAEAGFQCEGMAQTGNTAHVSHMRILPASEGNAHMQKVRAAATAGSLRNCQRCHLCAMS